MEIFNEDAAGHDHAPAGSDKGGEFVSKVGGEGGATKAPEKGKIRARMRNLAEAAKQVKVTDDKLGGAEIGSRDYDEIEATLDDDEKEEMADSLKEWKENYIDQRMSDFDPELDTTQAAKAAGWDDNDVRDKAKELIDGIDDEENLRGAAEKEIDDWYSSTRAVGEDAFNELADELDKDGDYKELAGKIREQADHARIDVEEKLDEQREAAESGQREELEDHYDESDDRIEFLKQFYRDHSEESRFSGGSDVKNVWGRDGDGDRLYSFETKAGQSYNIAAIKTDYLGKVEGEEISFSDQSGKYSIASRKDGKATAGKGDAHEVFSTVSEAVAGLVHHEHPPVISFTAAEPTRQKLYDRLVRDVAAIQPDYAALSISPPGAPRRYMVIERSRVAELKETLEAMGKGSEVNTLVASEDLPKIKGVKWLDPATSEEQEEWRTPGAWPEKFSEPTSEVALAGPDGQRAADLLGAAKKSGTDLLSHLTQQALTRLLSLPNPLDHPILFSDDELRQIAESFASTLATADLLGRSRIRQHASQVQNFAEARDKDGKWTSGGGSASKVEYPKGFTPSQPSAGKWGNAPNHLAPDEARPALTIDQAKAIQAYTGVTMWPKLSRALRNNTPLTGSILKVDQELQAAFARAPKFSEPIKVYRGITGDQEKVAKIASAAKEAMETGGVFKMPSYSSTATADHGGYSGNIKFDINATHGLDVKPYSMVPGENEILLDRNANFKVKGIEKKGDELHIELDQIPPAKHDPKAESGRKKGLWEKLTGRFAEEPNKWDGGEDEADAIIEAIIGARPIEKFDDPLPQQPAPFAPFVNPIPPLPPEQAINYFQALVPTLGTDVLRYGPQLERHAFTLAVATDNVILDKVKQAITARLKGDLPVGTATDDIQQILDACGVSHRNPQYAEQIYRTNMMDSFNTGQSAELADPTMQDWFPVQRYDGILDSRTGEDHRPKIGKYYPSDIPFAEIRGPRPWNCRCTTTPINKFQWAELKGRGAVLSAP